MDTVHTADLERILKKLGNADLIALLVEEISGGDLNTLLLKIFNERLKTSTPSDLLKRYRDNRFVHPAEVDAIQLKQLEMDVLNIAIHHGVSPIQLSPVAPLGSFFHNP
ncbi:hypothetical protein [Paenibacillus eucommiae]|uniref:Uncharacterized protein related to proFAR isomerase n=1 Tax=Paenibacillus eucommiae TaxID=1355755 RepID=A0ABS4JBU2_9BACL|nr:hypothetical protein [Paenibacillus eucommiae]MBP1996209.1 uncharacterized protein related to proFAR isomerase [Paenibacillus eucommiae]